MYKYNNYQTFGSNTLSPSLGDKVTKKKKKKKDLLGCDLWNEISFNSKKNQSSSTNKIKYIPSQFWNTSVFTLELNQGVYHERIRILLTRKSSYIGACSWKKISDTLFRCYHKASSNDCHFSRFLFKWVSETNQTNQSQTS